MFSSHKAYYLADYLKELKKSGDVFYKARIEAQGKNLSGFYKTCSSCQIEINKMFNTGDPSVDTIRLEKLKRALQGYPEEVAFFINKIQEYLEVNGLINEQYPDYFNTLSEAVFHETWGFGSLAPWLNNSKPEYSTSSSAAIMGDDVFFLLDGAMRLQSQKFTRERALALMNVLLLNTDNTSRNDPFYDIFLFDGTRVTIFGQEYVKNGRIAIFVRKFFVNEYTFNQQASMGTIPYKAIPFFESMIKCGYNIAIVGGPNTGKTTFYATMQAYQDITKQGIQIETDPEVDISKLSPGSPVLQLIADGENLKKLMKPILRADPEHVTFGEVRDGYAADLILRAAKKGTRNVRFTYHITNVIGFCSQLAEEIVEVSGGSVKHKAIDAARNFDFVVEMTYLPTDKSKKRLKSIHELSYDEASRQIVVTPICKYDITNDSWVWAKELSESKRDIGYFHNHEANTDMCKVLHKLWTESPYSGVAHYTPVYD